MRKIRMTISYHGGDFCGWQVQKSDRTVQGELEAALLKMEKKEVRASAAGRTDSGVHAHEQTVHFDSGIESMEPEKYAAALNTLLPPDIRVLKSMEAAEGFHARYSAVARSYRYYLFRGSMVPLSLRPFCYGRKDIPSVAALNRVVAPLVGEHDFTPFVAAGDPSPSKVRTIYQAAFLEHQGTLQFRICANGFLWKMVRSIVGTAIEAAADSDPAGKMRSIISRGEREGAGTTAPARGLFFWKAFYGGEHWYG